MDLKKIIESVKIILLLFVILTLISQIFNPPVIYVPGFILSLFDILFPAEDELLQTTELESICEIISLFVTTAVIFYSGYRATNNLKMDLFSSGIAGSLIAGIPHFVALIVINISVYLPEVIPEMYEELGGLCILAVPIFYFIQAIPLLIDLVLGFMAGLLGGFIGKSIMDNECK